MGKEKGSGERWGPRQDTRVKKDRLEQHDIGAAASIFFDHSSFLTTISQKSGEPHFDYISRLGTCQKNMDNALRVLENADDIPALTIALKTYDFLQRETPQLADKDEVLSLAKAAYANALLEIDTRRASAYKQAREAADNATVEKKAAVKQALGEYISAEITRLVERQDEIQQMVESVQAAYSFIAGEVGSSVVAKVDISKDDPSEITRGKMATAKTDAKAALQKHPNVRDMLMKILPTLSSLVELRSFLSDLDTDLSQSTKLQAERESLQQTKSPIHKILKQGREKIDTLLFFGQRADVYRFSGNYNRPKLSESAKQQLLGGELKVVQRKPAAGGKFTFPVVQLPDGTYIVIDEDISTAMRRAESVAGIADPRPRFQTSNKPAKGTPKPNKYKPNKRPK